jgi:ubiquinone/menaquinone biosynthesis C-methylase UbiE
MIIHGIIERGKKYIKGIVVQKGQYIVSNEHSHEGERLRLLNEAYAPIAQKVLSKYLKKGDAILEIGMGSGEMGAWFSDQIGPSGKYMGVDVNPTQIERASQHLKESKNVTLIQENIFNLDKNSKFLQIKPLQGFNLIYCRWLLCHILESDRKKFIQIILSLLAPNGVFICEDSDYRGMYLQVSGIPSESKAIDGWKEITILLKQKGVLNLEYSPEKMLADFKEIIKDSPQYTAEIVEVFQAELKGKQKYSLIYGLETIKKAALVHAEYSEEKIDNLIKEFKKIAENNLATVFFYFNTFGRIMKQEAKKS